MNVRKLRTFVTLCGVGPAVSLACSFALDFEERGCRADTDCVFQSGPGTCVDNVCVEEVLGGGTTVGGTNEASMTSVKPTENETEAVESTTDAVMEQESTDGPMIAEPCVEPLSIDAVLIPGGSFVDTFVLDDRSGPQVSHDVETFRMERTEVTVAQYQACVDDLACAPPGLIFGALEAPDLFNYSAPGRATHPVNGVSWFDAQAYCAWTCGRLPTEWEWEWAARGRGEGRTYPWGNAPEPNCDLAVMFSDESGCGERHTDVVGSKPSDGLDGGVDMAGNLSEWTASPYYDSAYYDRRFSESDTVVLRGGDWGSDYAPRFRADFREEVLPTLVSEYVGFRCARSAP